jgi:hypothetical protein
MTHSASDWYQQTLTPPDVIECRIRVGVVPTQDHCQVQVDLFDPISGAQVGQWSRPHGPLSTWQSMVDEAVQKAHQFLGDSIEPF